MGNFKKEKREGWKVANMLASSGNITALRTIKDDNCHWDGSVFCFEGFKCPKTQTDKEFGIQKVGIPRILIFTYLSWQST